jgi:hypothetical protein
MSSELLHDGSYVPSSVVLNVGIGLSHLQEYEPKVLNTFAQQFFNEKKRSFQGEIVPTLRKYLIVDAQGQMNDNVVKVVHNSLRLSEGAWSVVRAAQ